MQDASKPRSRAFTLVELMVVIAIIAILLSILLPVITRARRKAMILVSPVAYQTWADNGYHLADDKLSWDIPIFREPGSAGGRRPGDVVWSPSGLKMGFEVSNWGGGNGQRQCMCVLTPLTGEIRKHPQMSDIDGWPRTYFFGWVDDFTFIEQAGRAGKLYLRDATSGTVVKTIQCNNWGVNYPYSNLPVSAPAPFICIGGKPGGYGVYLAGKDLRPTKAIWISPDTEGPLNPNGRVAADPSGQWVAFNVGNGYTTAIKRMDDPVAMPPKLIKVKDRLGNPCGFATWIGRNELLHTAGPEMIVVDRDGNVLRTAQIGESVVAGQAACFRRLLPY